MNELILAPLVGSDPLNTTLYHSDSLDSHNTKRLSGIQVIDILFREACYVIHD